MSPWELSNPVCMALPFPVIFPCKNIFTSGCLKLFNISPVPSVEPSSMTKTSFYKIGVAKNGIYDFLDCVFFVEYGYNDANFYVCRVCFLLHEDVNLIPSLWQGIFYKVRDSNQYPLSLLIFGYW